MNWLGFVYYGVALVLGIFIVGIIIRAIMDAIEALTED